MVFANPSLAIISHTWAEDLSVSQFLITKTIMTDRVRFTGFPDFTWNYRKIPENTVNKFLCFSQVFLEPCLKSNLIWPRWCRNKILDSVRKNTLISSNCPYVPHLLLERLNRYQKPELIDFIITTFLTLNFLTVTLYFRHYHSIRFVRLFQRLQSTKEDCGSKRYKRPFWDWPIKAEKIKGSNWH